jgi:hypothetical protein
MNVRWRLALAAVQVFVLSFASWIVVGTFFPFSIWFVSGLLGVVLALQLTEPFFTRPVDVLVSAVSVILLVLVADRTSLPFAWWAVLIYSAVGGVVALLASVARRDVFDTRGAELSFRAYQLMRAFAGKGLYSAVFIVALLSEFDTDLVAIVVLGAAWALVLALSSVRWDRLFTGRRSESKLFEVVGMVAPRRLMMVGRAAEFELGSEVELQRRSHRAKAHVVRRLPRRRNTLLEVLLLSSSDAERFLGHSVQLTARDGARLVGTVAADTSDTILVFFPLSELPVGSAVSSLGSNSREVVHQIAELKLVELSEPTGGSELVVRAMALQVGEVNIDGTVSPSRNVLVPGTSVRPFEMGKFSALAAPDQFSVGTVMGTDLPVSLSIATLTRGHAAVLGMTGMGKSAFTKRLAMKLGESHPVVVVDQTGEYRKLGLPPALPATASTPGVTLKDIARGPNQHKEALRVLEVLADLGRTEFDRGDDPIRRVLIVEEAHQFVPEPSMLGFGAPGREEAIQFGLLLMQVRKFGVSVILVSQRTAVVAKSALSQCENIVAFKSVDQTGLDYLGATGGTAATHLLPKLRLGEAVLMGPAASTQNAIGVHLLHEEPTPSGVGPTVAATPSPAASLATILPQPIDDSDDPTPF